MKGAVLSNVYSRFKAYVGYGNEDVFRLKYENVMRNRRSTGNTLALSREMMQTTSQERAMFLWIEYITGLSLPISYIQNSITCNFSKHNERILVTILKKTLSLLIRLAEGIVMKEIKYAGCYHP